MEDEQQMFLRLGVALAIGLVIGVERGWKVREAREGERVAGVRTYGLIGLLGGGMALVAERLGPLPLALAFVALAGVLDHGLCDHCRARRRRGHHEPSRRASGLRIRCAGRARPGGRGRRLRGGHDPIAGLQAGAAPLGERAGGKGAARSAQAAPDLGGVPADPPRPRLWSGRP